VCCASFIDARPARERTLAQHTHALVEPPRKLGILPCAELAAAHWLNGPPGPLHARDARRDGTGSGGPVLAVHEALFELGLAARALGQDRASIVRSEFAKLLSQRLSEENLAAGGAGGCAVSLVELRELPGRSFDHLIVIG